MKYFVFIIGLCSNFLSSGFSCDLKEEEELFVRAFYAILPELVFENFSELPFQDRVNLRLVSKQSKADVDLYFWRHKTKIILKNGWHHGLTSEAYSPCYSAFSFINSFIYSLKSYFPSLYSPYPPVTFIEILQNLPHRKLKFTFFRWTPEDFQALSRLTNCTTLCLPFNWKQDQCETALGHISSLTQLTSLNLKGNTWNIHTYNIFRPNADRNNFDCKVLYPLTKLPHLTALNLSLNIFDLSGIQILSELTNLRKLKLEDTGMTSVELLFLKPLTNLTDLTLGRNLIDTKGMQVIINFMTNLQILFIHDNQIQLDDLQNLSKLSKLQCLNFGHNKIGQEKLEPLSVLTNLVYLNLWGNKLVSSDINALTALTELESLVLYKNEITDECVPILIRMTSLQDLILSNNLLTPQGQQKLIQHKKQGLLF